MTLSILSIFVHLDGADQGLKLPATKAATLPQTVATKC